MALPVTIPNAFANATASIPLSQLDTNFNTLANAVNGISDGSETLANVSATVLTAGTVDINGGTIDGTAIGGASAAAVSATTLNTSGQVVFNDAGADVDFRVESDTKTHALFVDGATGVVGVNVEPAAWGSSYQVVQIGEDSGVSNFSTGGYAFVSQNVLFGPSSNTYIKSAPATYYRQFNGTHGFFTAASGTAGNAATFTQAMTLDSGGNVLVGKTTTNPTVAGIGLEAGGDAYFTTEGASGRVIYANRLTSDGTIIQLLKDSAAVGAIGTTGGELYIDFGGSTGGAVSSRTLDDYEEGTFTPTIVGSTSAGTGTYTQQIGRYTKIGRVVQFVISLGWSAHTGTGNMTVAGLPFTSLNAGTGSFTQAVSIASSNITFSNQLAAYIGNNDTAVSPVTISTGAVNALISIDTAGTFWLCGTYEAA